MRKILLLIVLFGVTITGVRAQVGIGTKDPDKRAQLDITSDPGKKGLLIPRVKLTDIEMTLSGANDKSEMPNSILVFNTGTFTETINGVAKGFAPGYYYWDVNADGRTGKGAWVALLSGGNAKNIQNFFNTINTNSSTVVYNSASNTFDLKVGNGLRNLTDTSGNPYVGLGGQITKDTEIEVATLAGGKLKIKGLNSGNASSTIVTLNPSTNELQYLEKLNVLQIETGGTANNDKVLTVKGGKAEWIPVTGTASNSLVQAENGLHMSTAGKVSLGGDLTEATKIKTTSSNTLAIEGLQTSTTGVDRLVVADPVSGILKQIEGVSVKQIDAGTNTDKFLTVDKNGVVTWTGFGGTSTSSIDFSGLAGNGLVFNSASGTLEVQAENGLKVEDDKVKLGGDLTKATRIKTTSSNTLAIEGLQNGADDDKIVVTDANGVLRTVTGVTTAQIKGGTTNAGKILTVNNAGVVTWTSLGGSATNTIDFSGLAGDGLTYSTTTGKLNVVPGNGIQIDGNNKVEWGGKLTKTATIETDDNKAFVIKPGGTRTTSNVVIKDLPTGTVTDSFVVVDKDGNLKTVDPKSAAKINYTNGPQETGRRWQLGGVDQAVQEITFEVTFTNTTYVDIATKLIQLNAIADKQELKVLSIRAIEKTGATKNTNTAPTSITQSGVYNPGTGELMLGMSSSTLFSVKFDGTFYIVVEFIRLP